MARTASVRRALLLLNLALAGCSGEEPGAAGGSTGGATLGGFTSTAGSRGTSSAGSGSDSTSSTGGSSTGTPSSSASTGASSSSTTGTGGTLGSGGTLGTLGASSSSGSGSSSGTRGSSSGASTTGASSSATSSSTGGRSSSSGSTSSTGSTSTSASSTSSSSSTGSSGSSGGVPVTVSWPLPAAPTFERSARSYGNHELFAVGDPFAPQLVVGVPNIGEDSHGRGGIGEAQWQRVDTRSAQPVGPLNAIPGCVFPGSWTAAGSRLAVACLGRNRPDGGFAQDEERVMVVNLLDGGVQTTPTRLRVNGMAFAGDRLVTATFLGAATSWAADNLAAGAIPLSQRPCSTGVLYAVASHPTLTGLVLADCVVPAQVAATLVYADGGNSPPVYLPVDGGGVREVVGIPTRHPSGPYRFVVDSNSYELRMVEFTNGGLAMLPGGMPLLGPFGAAPTTLEDEAFVLVSSPPGSSSQTTVRVELLNGTLQSQGTVLGVTGFDPVAVTPKEFWGTGSGVLKRTRLP